MCSATKTDDRKTCPRHLVLLGLGLLLAVGLAVFLSALTAVTWARQQPGTMRWVREDLDVLFLPVDVVQAMSPDSTTVYVLTAAYGTGQGGEAGQEAGQ